MRSEAHPFELDVCANCEKVYTRPTPKMIGGLAIKPALRVVYRVEIGGRAKSFLSARGAYRRYARMRIGQKRECPGHEDWADGGFRAEHYHATGNCVAYDDDRLWSRFVRWLMWHDRRTRKLGCSPFAKGESA